MTLKSGVELSLIIPAFNEAAIITRNVGEVQAHMRDHLPDTSYEIIVVDDGSTDGMAEQVADYAKANKNVRLVRHKRNFGRGRAIRSGFEESRGDFVICLDADLSYAPEHIGRLLQPLKDDEADVTLASAYHPTGSVTNVPTARAVMSRWGNKVLRTGLKSNIHTVTCIVRGFRRETLDMLELINDGKDLHLEIIQKAELFGLRLKEVAGHLKWRDRTRGSKPRSRLVDFVPFLSMSGTIASHLVYSYVLRPSTMLNIPVIGLIFIVALTSFSLAWSWVENLLGPGAFGWTKLFQTLRETLLHGSLTFFVMVVSFFVLIILIAFYFASQQSKRNHDDVYILLSRMNARLKELERNRSN